MAEAPEQSNHTLTTLSMLEQLQSEWEYWDVKIRVGTTVFKCQRSLLAVNSEYFDTMFSSDFEESNITIDEPITLQDMDASAFNVLLHFIYTGDFIRVNDSKVLPLLIMNDFLRLRSGHIKEQCLEHVKKRSQESDPLSNALDLLCFAYLKEENVLVDSLRAHICRHLYHYSKDARLMEIAFEILNDLLKFSKDYIVPLRGSADVLLKIVHNWINHDREGRNQYLSNLLENIDFANVSPNFSGSLIKRLENAVNEVVNFSKDIESLSELKMLIMGIDIRLTDGIGQFDAIISFKFEKVSELQVDDILYSSSCIISDLSWKIGIRRRDDELIMAPYCYGTNPTIVWNCYVATVFTIVSHKEGRNNFVREGSRRLFTSNKMSTGWGPVLRLKWDYLKDSANGYLDDDDSITLNVHVYRDVPFLEMI